MKTLASSYVPSGSPGGSAAARAGRLRAWAHFARWMRKTHRDVCAPHAVTPSMAREYMESFRRDHAPVTCGIRAAALKGIFRELLAGTGGAVNPWDGVKAGAGGGHVRRVLTQDEVSRLVERAGDSGPEWKTLFLLAAYTGMRLGDCCRLRWESVDCASSVIRFVPHKTRRYANGRETVVPLHPELAALLRVQAASGASGFVLGGIAEDFATRRWRVSRRLERIFAAAGIRTSVMLEGRTRRTPEATFHSLRHTFVSLAVNAGAPISAVQSIVGHASASMTRRYYHPDEAALRMAVLAIPSIGKPHRAPSGAGRPGGIAARGGASGGICARLLEMEKARKRGLVSEEEYLEIRSRILSEA